MISSVAKLNQSYLAELDGLRGVSVLIVTLGHFGLGYIIPSGLGVTVFFFISGFIITRMMIQESTLYGSIALRSFYVRRFFRLAPALLVFVLASNLLIVSFGRSLPLDDNLVAIFYLANYRYLFGDWGGVTDENIYNPLSILWSLAIEEHFYFFYPLLFMFLFGKGLKLFSSLLFLVVLVLLWRSSLAIDYLGQTGLIDTSRTYKGTGARIDSILYGCLLSVVLACQEGSGHLRQAMRRMSGTVALCIGFALLLISLLVRDIFFREAIRYSIQGVALFVVFAAIFGGQGILAGRIKVWLAARWLVFVGKISYSLYLYHWLVFVALVEWFPRPQIGVLLSTAPSRLAVVESLAALAAIQLLIGLPLSLLLAYASWRWVEQPLRRVGHDLAQRLGNRRALKDRAPSSS